MYSMEVCCMLPVYIYAIYIYILEQLCRLAGFWLCSLHSLASTAPINLQVTSLFLTPLHVFK